jgi:Na+/H+ antiporter
MALFELVIALLLAGALLTAWSRRIGVPYPTLLALAGAAAAFLPGTPDIVLEPDLALALFVAPVLLDAAFDASPRDLRDNWLPIGGLAVVAVGLTVVAVAIVARIMVPEMPWPAAVALGAIVAPPDASAATTVLKHVRPPHRLLVILEGESLLNDASALLIYRAAVGAVASGAVLGWQILPMLLGTAGGGAVLGWILARCWRLLPAHREDLPVDVLVQFLGTFAVWMVADRLGVSAIITVVVYAMTIARGSPHVHGRRRIASYAVWDVAVFVLNILAFVLIGLQLKGIRSRLDGEWGLYLEIAGVICGVVILVRLVWVLAFNTTICWKNRFFGESKSRQPLRPTLKGGLVIGWCGMRGIVTLATALALPDQFPQRDVIVFCAFCVVLGTLVLQGLTLRPLMQSLNLPEDLSVQEEVRVARQATAHAALAVLEAGAADQSEAGRLLHREYTARATGGAETDADEGTIAGLQDQVVTAQRETLLRLRRDGTIGDDAFHVVEEELDIIQLTADPRVRTLDSAG